MRRPFLKRTQMYKIRMKNHKLKIPKWKQLKNLYSILLFLLFLDHHSNLIIYTYKLTKLQYGRFLLALLLLEVFIYLFWERGIFFIYGKRGIFYICYFLFGKLIMLILHTHMIIVVFSIYSEDLVMTSFKI